jgi:hypothetical protein
MKMAILIFTAAIGKCGGKFKILKCLKQTLNPFPQQSTLEPLYCQIKWPPNTHCENFPPRFLLKFGQYNCVSNSRNLCQMDQRLYLRRPNVVLQALLVPLIFH